jgi:hypothetical protein
MVTPVVIANAKYKIGWLVKIAPSKDASIAAMMLKGEERIINSMWYVNGVVTYQLARTRIPFKEDELILVSKRPSLEVQMTVNDNATKQEKTIRHLPVSLSETFTEKQIDKAIEEAAKSVQEDSVKIVKQEKSFFDGLTANV